MVLVLQFGSAVILYSLMAYLSYSPLLKDGSNWVLFSAPLLGFIANLIWFQIAKTDTNHNSLILKGLYWDILLTFCYLLVPIIFYNISLTTNQVAGIILIISGIILTKI